MNCPRCRAANRQGRHELALARGGYARLWRERGDRDQARRLYARSLETLERLGSLAEPPVIRRALAELDGAHHQ